MGGKASKEVQRRASQRYAAAHPDRVRMFWKNWYATAKADPEWIARRAAQKHASYLRTKAKRIATSQRWAEANRDRTRAASKRFREAHLIDERKRCVEKSALRLKLMRETAVGQIDYEAVVRAANGHCGICKQPFDDTQLHFDHIVPLGRGGLHIQENIQLTHARCNLVKGARVLKDVG